MPRYEYRCPDGHESEIVLPMADEKPESVTCWHTDGDVLTQPVCGKQATRVWAPWAATHFHGTGGTYYEDVYRGKDGGTRYGYKRRKNAGDDLPVAGL